MGPTTVVSTRGSTMHSHTRLEFIIEAVPALIGYVDVDERYRFNNLAYQDWFGRPVETYTGRTVREVLGDVAYAAVAQHVQTASPASSSPSRASWPIVMASRAMCAPPTCPTWARTAGCAASWPTSTTSAISSTPRRSASSYGDTPMSWRACPAGLPSRSTSARWRSGSPSASCHCFRRSPRWSGCCSPMARSLAWPSRASGWRTSSPATSCLPALASWDAPSSRGAPSGRATSSRSRACSHPGFPAGPGGRGPPRGARGAAAGQGRGHRRGLHGSRGDSYVLAGRDRPAPGLRRPGGPGDA